MRNEPHVIKARVWEWQGKGSWHFATIEKRDADLIRNDWVWPRKGFGSIPVRAVIGKTSWQTSVFPEKGGTYLLPLKKAVRDAENIKVGQTVEILLEVIS